MLRISNQRGCWKYSFVTTNQTSRHFENLSSQFNTNSILPAAPWDTPDAYKYLVSYKPLTRSSGPGPHHLKSFDHARNLPVSHSMRDMVCSYCKLINPKLTTIPYHMQEMTDGD